MKTISDLIYDKFLTVVKVTGEVDSVLKEEGIDLVPFLPSLEEFYEKKLFPKLKENKIRRHYRFEMVCCFVAMTLREARSWKVLLERCKVRKEDILINGFFRVEKNKVPFFWVRWVVLKA